MILQFELWRPSNNMFHVMNLTGMISYCLKQWQRNFGSQNFFSFCVFKRNFHSFFSWFKKTSCNKYYQLKTFKISWFTHEPYKNNFCLCLRLHDMEIWTRIFLLDLGETWWYPIMGQFQMRKSNVKRLNNKKIAIVYTKKINK